VEKIKSFLILEQLVNIVTNFFPADGSNWVSLSDTYMNVAMLVSSK